MITIICWTILFVPWAIAIPTTVPKQCGLPSNINELPDFAQDELRAVWKDYMPGRKCEKELLITEDILTVLAMFDKELDGQGQQPNEKNTRAVQEAGEGQSSKLGQAIPLGPPLLRNSPSTSGTARTPLPTSSSPTTSLSGKDSPQTVEEQSAEVEQAVYEHPQPSEGSKKQKLTPPNPDKPHRLSKFPAPHDFDYDAATGETYLRSETVPDDTVKRPSKQKVTEYEDEYGGGEEGKVRLSEDKSEQVQAGPKQYESIRRKLPFLKGVDADVVEVFREVMEDPDIPSESRRQEEIHLLAVSYLNARQLEEFDRWSTARRKRLRAREQQLHNLSAPGRRALRRLALAADVQQRRDTLARMPGALRDELQSWGKSRERDWRGKDEEEGKNGNNADERDSGKFHVLAISNAFVADHQ